MIDLALLAIFRDEAPNLAEWIAFHMAQGVGHIRLYDNRSADDWRPQVAPFADVVEVIPWDHAAPCQMEAYAHGLTALRGTAARVAVLDVDEYLYCPQRGVRALDVIREYLPDNGEDGGGLGVNWMCYGPGGNATRPAGLTVEAYTRRPVAQLETNRHIKSIVRPERVLAIRDPHSFYVQGMPIDELRRPLPGPFTDDPTHARLRVNHYLTRSLAEWAAKVERGRADTGTRRDPDEWMGYEGDTFDNTAAQWADEVRHILSSRKVPGWSYKSEAA